MRRFLALATALLTATSTSITYAHPHHELHVHATGFEAGLMHPLFGLDHLLAMVTVGILATVGGARSVWLAPATFLAAMVLGGMAGMAGRGLWAAETGIELSVVLLGAALVVGRAPPRVATVLSCALFGYFHGHAHGAEMPSISQPALYALGFLLATASLHVAGILVGRFFKRTNGRRLALRFAGCGISAAGIFLLLRT